jgi:hypothetical protein
LIPPGIFLKNDTNYNIDAVPIFEFQPAYQDGKILLMHMSQNGFDDFRFFRICDRPTFVWVMEKRMEDIPSVRHERDQLASTAVVLQSLESKQRLTLTTKHQGCWCVFPLTPIQSPYKPRVSVYTYANR